MPEHPIPANRSPSPEPRIEAPSSVTPSRGPMNLGHQSLTYSEPETASWKHWPLPVLSSLRQSGLAPLRFDTGTAGGLLTKRSPGGM